MLVWFRPNEELASVNKSIPKSMWDASKQQPFPTVIGSYILAYSRRVMNNFIHIIDGFKQWKVYYTDTDSLFMDKASYQMLIDAGAVGNNNFQGKNDLDTRHVWNCKEREQHTGIKPICTSDCQCEHIYYAENEIVEAYFAGPKQKWVVIRDKKSGMIQEKVTLKGVPMRVKNGLYVTDLIDKSHFKRLIEANRNGTDEEVIKIEYTDRLRRSMTGIQTYDISKRLSVEKYKCKMTLIGNDYVPIYFN